MNSKTLGGDELKTRIKNKNENNRNNENNQGPESKGR